MEKAVYENAGGKNYSRTGRILLKKMNILLLPSILVSLATSLNEFVDSILMSNLLGSSAMAVINYCFCIMLFYAAVQALFGGGGSIIYARRAGSKKSSEAENVFSECVWASAIVSILIAAAGCVFVRPLASLLCSDTDLRNDFIKYLFPLLLSAPLVIIINSICYFLPIMGKPVLSMTLVVTANVVNLIMDYIYVRFFNMGVEGAALATLTGYVVSWLVFAVLLVTGKCRIKIRPKLFPGIRELNEVLLVGIPQALFQVCFGIQNVYFNHVSYDLGNSSGNIAFALQSQLQSIVSIVLCGMGDTLIGFIAILKAQDDHKGIRYVMKRSIVLMSIFTLLLLVIFEIYPQIVLDVYGIDDGALTDAIAAEAVRIFAFTYVFRSISILLCNYFNASGHDYYAMGIIFADSIAGLFIWSRILIPIFGLTGLWLTYPVNAFMLLAAILLINYLYTKVHKEYRGLLLLTYNPDIKKRLCLTIEDNDYDIGQVSKAVTIFCAENGLNDELGRNAGLLTEEMCIFASGRNTKRLFIDITVSILKDGAQIDFRHLGEAANPLCENELDMKENIRIIKGLSSKIEYDYSLGMNSTRIVFT